MIAVSIAVLALFTLCVTGLVVMALTGSDDQPAERGGDEDAAEGDDAWLVELRALNDAMPRVRKHRARAAARTTRDKP